MHPKENMSAHLGIEPRTMLWGDTYIYIYIRYFDVYFNPDSLDLILQVVAASPDGASAWIDVQFVSII